MKKREQINLLNYFFCIILAFFFINRGSYFPKDFYISVILFSSIFLFYIIKKNIDNKKFEFSKDNFMHYAFLYLILLTFISIFWSIYKRGTVDEIFKWFVSLLIFYFIYDNIKNYSDRKTYQYFFIILGVFSAFFGILSYWDVIKISGMVVNNRIGSFIQYPNTYASFLSLSIILTIPLLFNEKKLLNKILISSVITFLSTTLFLTGSRGGIIIFVFVLVLFSILEKESFISNLTIYIYAIILPLVFIVLNNYFNPFILCLIMLSFIIIINYINKFRIKPYITLIVSLSIFFVVLLIFRNNVYIQRILSIINPNTYLGLSGLSGRTGLYITSFNIFKDFPIFGTGFGTYQYIYMKYRPNLTYSKFPHSIPLQILSETGIIGFIVYVIFIISILYYLVKNYNKRDILYKSFTVAFISLLIHSFLDFDLSIPVMLYIFSTLLGILASFNKDEKKKKRVAIPKYIINIISILLIIVIISSLFFLFANIYYNNANISKQNNYLEESLSLMQNSLIMDNYNSEYHNFIGEIYTDLGVNKKDINYINEAKKEFEKAISLNRYYFIYYSNLGFANYYLNQKDEAISNLRKAIELNPKDSLNYYNLASILKNYDELLEAEDYLIKALKMNKDLTEAKNLLKDVWQNLETKEFKIEIINPQENQNIKLSNELLIKWERTGVNPNLEYFAIYYYDNSWKLIGYADFFEDSILWELPKTEGEIKIIVYARDKEGNTLNFDMVKFNISN